MDNIIYFAAGFYGGTLWKPAVFGLVSTGRPGALPYLTRNTKGLRLTSHHANLYRLSEDGTKAVLADLRCLQAGFVREVELTRQQQEDIRQAVKANYFFE